MVKKEVFEWIRTGRKTIELRRGKLSKVTMWSFSVEGTFSRASIKELP